MTGDPICFNGKFTAQRTTGVQRVARQLLLALDGLPSTAQRCYTLLCPAGVTLPVLTRIAVRAVGPHGLPLHAWEQAVLPPAAARRQALLVNLAGSAAWAAPARQVCLIHDAAVFDVPQAYTRAFVGWYRALFRRLARRAARVLTVSAFSRVRLSTALDIDAARIGVLPNGADHLDDVAADEALLTRHGLPGTRFLLAVGSANPTKNLAALTAAFARLPASPDNCRLVIAGGHNARVFAAETQADPPGVLRLGAVDDATLKALYQHAVALVFPSTYEGCGLPPLEAMRCGCPVAAARAAAIPEVCGDAALYFDPHTVDSITAALQQLLSDGDLRARLRIAGTARAATWRWADAARRLDDELQAVLAGRSAQPQRTQHRAG